MSTLYIRLPSHAVAESLQAGMPLYCEYALATSGGALEREGMTALPDMGELVRKAQRVVLLLAPGDVTLLRVKVPPLSPARLKTALPNLVEDQLMSDPEECVVVADSSRSDTRTVAVVQRNWLELLAKTFVTMGARRISALPAQLCLPHQHDAASAAVAEHGADIDVAVRLSEHEGIGLSIVADQPESAAFEVMQSLSLMVPHGAIFLYVPQARVRDYQESLHIAPALEERITLHADNWPRWIGASDKVTVDLMTGLSAASGPQFDWSRWRWPVALAVALLAVNVIGLNVDWLRMKREAEVLRTSMVQTYKAAFPKDTVVVDPLAQVRQKLSAGQHLSGRLAPDDFVALAASFGEAWSSIGQGAGTIAGIEYRDRSLTVKFKPEVSVPKDQLTGALASRNLSATQLSNSVWQIRSGK
ncbi:type II secretion system protein GspL [Noviherbaspirillum saxi]|uniref:General secretion pathway protein GspL n=1 Tax=Noviherbaspirillum saxi TaxID=2320863 RepID=A0A3A3G9M4_9BURK|nr:type II secretion system protein GspL [Noviherbaspirillum saxi]RJF97569.1 general secretion pathway protein GspL [Noviherbaspirillum saxi]